MTNFGGSRSSNPIHWPRCAAPKRLPPAAYCESGKHIEVAAAAGCRLAAASDEASRRLCCRSRSKDLSGTDISLGIAVDGLDCELCLMGALFSNSLDLLISKQMQVKLFKFEF